MFFSFLFSNKCRVDDKKLFLRIEVESSLRPCAYFDGRLLPIFKPFQGRSFVRLSVCSFVLSFVCLFVRLIVRSFLRSNHKVVVFGQKFFLSFFLFLSACVI